MVVVEDVAVAVAVAVVVERKHGLPHLLSPVVCSNLTFFVGFKGVTKVSQDLNLNHLTKISSVT